MTGRRAQGEGAMERWSEGATGRVRKDTRHRTQDARKDNFRLVNDFKP